MSDKPDLISNNLLFPAGTRLMCPNCGTISNNHKASLPLYAQYRHGIPDNPQWVSFHTCSCGYCDDSGGGFTDSGNYECDDTRDIQKWEDELAELEEEMEELKYKIQKGKDRWEELWGTNEDRCY